MYMTAPSLASSCASCTGEMNSQIIKWFLTTDTASTRLSPLYGSHCFSFRMQDIETNRFKPLLQLTQVYVAKKEKV